MELLAAIMIPAALAAVSVVSIRLLTRHQDRTSGAVHRGDRRGTAAGRPRTASLSGFRDWRVLRLSAGRWAERLREELYRLPPERAPAERVPPERAGVVCASCGLEQPIEYVRCLRCGSVDRGRVNEQRTDPPR